MTFPLKKMKLGFSVATFDYSRVKLQSIQAAELKMTRCRIDPQWCSCYPHVFLQCSFCLVVYLPFWKIWVRQFGWLFPIWWEHKIHVPNHQSFYGVLSQDFQKIRPSFGYFMILSYFLKKNPHVRYVHSRYPLVI